MAYQNAFTLGACTLEIYKGVDAGFPVLGFVLVPPEDYASENITIAQNGSVIDVSFSGASTGIYFYALVPSYAVGGSAVRMNLQGDETMQVLSVSALKTPDATALTYNQSSLVWTGSLEIVEINSELMMPEELPWYMEFTPNPVTLAQVLSWSRVGYLCSPDSLDYYNFSFSVEIDLVVTPPPDPEPTPVNTPWWYCVPKVPVICPVRETGFVPLSEYDADFKYPVASSRSVNKIEPTADGDCQPCTPTLIPPTE